ncbi:MAG: protoporphyrinogen oxidase [Deltaproteobacteria bacterium]|nr:protoporphyrinogen oxidase [Deltaproteobacteria bacterium]
MSRIVVVGAGISGLAAAFEIRRQAEHAGRNLELIVLEEQEQVGGKVRTVARGGYLCETGVQAFLDNSPPTLELAEALGLGPRLRRAQDVAKKRWIYSRGQLEELPMSPPRFLRSRLMSWPGKLRAALEPFARKRRPGVDETVAEFARRRLGDEALTVLVGPMVSGVFAGDPANLSVRSAFPKVVALEEKYGGLIRGMLALRKERGRDVDAGPGGTLTSFDTGMATPCEALARSLGDAVLVRTVVMQLERRDAGLRLRLGDGHLDADAVVLAVPAYVQARLLGPHDPACAGLLDRVPYPPLVVVCLGFRRDDVGHPLDGFGFLVPRREPIRLLGALFESTLFDGRAPAGHVLIRVMVGGATNPELCALDDPALLTLIQGELGGILGLKAKPVFSTVWRHEQAIPQYTVGHADRVAELETRAAKLGPLVLGGNAYRGISLNDCVRNARSVAQQAMAQVASKP